jgi:hypothetical protein
MYRYVDFLELILDVVRHVFRIGIAEIRTMNNEGTKSALDKDRDCSFKIVSDNVVSLGLAVEIAEADTSRSAEQESRCQNGVCALNWKPRRAA